MKRIVICVAIFSGSFLYGSGGDWRFYDGFYTINCVNHIGGCKCLGGNGSEVYNDNDIKTTIISTCIDNKDGANKMVEYNLFISEDQADFLDHTRFYGEEGFKKSVRRIFPMILDDIKDNFIKYSLCNLYFYLGTTLEDWPIVGTVRDSVVVDESGKDVLKSQNEKEFKRNFKRSHKSVKKNYRNFKFRRRQKSYQRNLKAVSKKNFCCRNKKRK